MPVSKRFGGIFDITGLKNQLVELEEIVSFPEFWSDQKRSTRVLREKATLERSLQSFVSIEENLEEAETLLEMAEEEGDDDTRAEAVAAFTDLEETVTKVEVHRLLSGEADERDAILEVNSGEGGTDAADWADMLKRMYIQWAKRSGYKVSIVDEVPNDEAGIKSCTLEIRGLYAFGYLKAECGVHRLVRISPFDANARRQTSFASIYATPDIDDSIEVDIKESDLRIDTMRAGGAGGQHVNTTDSAVRITHMPTGIVVKCQNERSQHKNKARAMKILRGRIYQHELDQRQAKMDEVNSEKKNIGFGSQIRSYVIHPYRMVKDHRTDHQVGNPDRVFDGDLMSFMEAWLKMRAGENGA